MRQSGFSLVELIVIMAIMGILLGIGTLNFSQMSRKSAVESQVKTLHADLMAVRSEALFRKRERALTIGGSTFAVYSSRTVTGTPVKTRALKYPVKNAGAVVIEFDTLGLSRFAVPEAVCISSPDDSPATDSVVVTRSMIFMGKLKPGMECNDENVVVR